MPDQPNPATYGFGSLTCTRSSFSFPGLCDPMQNDNLLDVAQPWSLLGNSMAAPLLSSQFKHSKQKPALSPACQIIKAATKPVKPKRKDPVSELQKQLDALTGNLKDLTLANQKLQKREQVLDVINRAVEQLETYATKARQDRSVPAPPIEEVDQTMTCADLDDAPHSPSYYRNLTADQFIDLYKANLQKASHWVLAAETGATQEILDKLSEINENSFEVIMYTGLCQPELLPKVRTEMLKQWPAGASEEEHWLSVVQATALTPQQEEIIMVAKDIFHNSLQRCSKERQDLGSCLQETLRAPAALNAASTMSIEDKKGLVDLIAANMNKYSNWLLSLTLVIYKEVLDPLQVARCALHAHPLIPSATIFMHAVASSIERRQAQAGAVPAPPPAEAPPAAPTTVPLPATTMVLADGLRRLPSDEQLQQQSLLQQTLLQTLQLQQQVPITVTAPMLQQALLQQTLLQTLQLQQQPEQQLQQALAVQQQLQQLAAQQVQQQQAQQQQAVLPAFLSTQPSMQQQLTALAELLPQQTATTAAAPSPVACGIDSMALDHSHLGMQLQPEPSAVQFNLASPAISQPQLASLLQPLPHTSLPAASPTYNTPAVPTPMLQIPGLLHSMSASSQSFPLTSPPSTPQPHPHSPLAHQFTMTTAPSVQSPMTSSLSPLNDPVVEQLLSWAQQ